MKEQQKATTTTTSSHHHQHTHPQQRQLRQLRQLRQRQKRNYNDDRSFLFVDLQRQKQRFFFLSSWRLISILFVLVIFGIYGWNTILLLNNTTSFSSGSTYYDTTAIAKEQPENNDNNNNNPYYYHYHYDHNGDDTTNNNNTITLSSSSKSESSSSSSFNLNFHFPSKEERVKYYMGDWYDIDTTIVQVEDINSRQQRQAHGQGQNDDENNGNNNNNSTTSNSVVVYKGWMASSEACHIPYFDLKYHSPKQEDAALIFDSYNIQDYKFKVYKQDILQYLLIPPTTTTTITTMISKLFNYNQNIKSQNDHDHHHNNNNIIKEDHDNNEVLPSPLVRLAIALGDQHPSLEHPVIMKSREVIKVTNDANANANSNNNNNHDDRIMVPIIALLGSDRHYSRVSKLQYERLLIDRQWKYKTSQLVWRGARTGYGNTARDRTAILEPLLQLQQKQKKQQNSNNNTIVPIDIAFEPKLTMKQLLEYKYLLVLEGNDVSSGLKWMLYSNSVVFMSQPTHVSYAMEDKLIPYVHYIPLKSYDIIDIQKQLNWAIQHDLECQQISKQATIYIENLYTSNQAKRDNIWIHQEIVKRYTKQFGPIFNQCVHTPLKL